MQSEKIKTELDKIMEYSIDMICTLNQEGHFVRVSAACSYVLGYDVQELVQKKFTDVIQYVDRAQVSEIFTAIIQYSASARFEVQCLSQDGRGVPVLWNAHWDAEDKLMYCIGRDATACKQAEDLRVSLQESETRYKYATRAASEAIWDWDIENATVYWGEGFQENFGHSMEQSEYPMSSWSKYIHPEDLNRVLQSIYITLDGNEINWMQEYRYLRADGFYAYVMDHGLIIRNERGRATRMFRAMKDISERKDHEDKLKRFARDLYKRNAELLQFGYLVSHSLRAPVANIIGLTNVFELYKNCDPYTVEHCVKNLQTAVGRLDEVIKDMNLILSLTDDSVEQKKDEVSVTELLKRVKHHLKDAIRISGADIRIHSEIPAFCTIPDHLYQIFYHLVSNAIKFRSDDIPRVKIGIRSQFDRVIVTVKDNGTGIDLEKYARDIFKPYKKFTLGREGKGLGLFLVKSYVEALCGTILVESSPGKGTAFTISLPVLN